VETITTPLFSSLAESIQMKISRHNATKRNGTHTSLLLDFSAPSERQLHKIDHHSQERETEMMTILLK